MEKNSQKRTLGQTLRLTKRFLPYFKPYWGMLAADLACAALTSACELILPLIMRYITDVGARDASLLTVNVILGIGGLYIALRVVDTAAYFYQTSRGHIMGSLIETDLRRDLFTHLQALSNAYYDDTKVGQLMSRITTDLNDVTEFAHHFPEEVFVAVVKIGVSFAILMGVNVPLTLAVYLAIPLMLFCSSRFNLRMRRAFRQSRHQLGELNAQVEDSLLGIRVVKAFSGEKEEARKFQQGNQGFLRIKESMYTWMAWFHSTTRLFDGLMYVMVLVMGGLFIHSGRIAAADLVAYMLYANMLLAAVRRMVEFTEQFQRGVTGIERFVEVMDEPVEIQDEPGAVDIGTAKGEVTFDHVSFSYRGAQEEVLTDINLRVEPGQSVALVGPSGGGKTTLCNLIPRFYDVTAGRIFIDGQDIRKVTLESLRAAIGVVQQDVYLFSGTVAENIAYGRPGATREEIAAAARLAGAEKFILALKDGYDTYVGERGVKLSGGQKQRLSIARVFLKNPPILILDEATSALDNESEILVGQSLEKLAHGRTTLTIAHRLTTIKDYDRILVLGEEGILEDGTHDQLLAKQGVYYRLWNQLPSLDLML